MGDVTDQATRYPRHWTGASPKMKEQSARVWLVNTGWIGGVYGTRQAAGKNRGLIQFSARRAERL
jgi:ATP-dependent phosphoenolpyruvate carboxykinase